MAKSKTQNEITELGKLLVKQFSLENSSDTLGRWMAHYIAEKMVVAQNATGKAKTTAEKECFQNILDFWKHRWVVQKEYRPFKSFEEILALLNRIDPDNFSPFYYNNPGKEINTEKNPWLAVAFDIDKAARVCLKYMLTLAANDAKSEDASAYLNIASAIGPDPDIPVIEALFDEKDYSFTPENIGLDNKQFDPDFSKASIKNQIAYLNKLEGHAKTVKALLKKKLKSATA